MMSTVYTDSDFLSPLVFNSCSYNSRHPLGPALQLANALVEPSPCEQNLW